MDTITILCLQESSNLASITHQMLSVQNDQIHEMHCDWFMLSAIIVDYIICQCHCLQSSIVTDWFNAEELAL